MELLMTESHMHLQDIKSTPSLTGQNNNKGMSSIRLNLLTKTTWKLKTPGGILVFRVLVQNCGGIRMFLRGGVLSIFQLPSYNGLDPCLGDK